MKRKTIYFFLTFVLSLMLGLFASACVNGNSSVESGDIRASVVSTEDKLVVIKVDSATENTTLVQVMSYLQQEGELTFSIGKDGMVNAINGKENDTVTWTPFWYLYTSDAELSNAEWGTATYGEITCGSAIFGADSLTVLGGEYYIWEYK